MADQIEILINTQTGKAKIDVDRLAEGFRRAQAAANKTADAMNKSNEQAKKNASTWEVLTGKIKDYFTAQNRAARIARRVATIYREATARLFQYSVAIADVSSNFLGFRNAIQVASGSVEEANKQMAIAADIAKTLKLDITVVTKEYSKFLNAVTLAGQSAEFAESKFRQFAIAARVLNLSTEATSGMFLALEQMISKETVSLEELRRQLGQHLPGAVAQAARAMGYGEGEIKDFYQAIEDGNVKSVELVDKLGNDVSKRTLPLLQQSLQKSSAAIQALRNEFTLMQVSLGVLLQPAIVAVADVLQIIFQAIRSLLPPTELFSTKLKEAADSGMDAAQILSLLADEETELAGVTDNLNNSFDR